MVNNLKKIRKAKGLTQQELSKISGINVTNISNYETNHSLPTVPIAIDLSKALGVTVNDIYILEEQDFE